MDTVLKAATPTVVIPNIANFSEVAVIESSKGWLSLRQFWNRSHHRCSKSHEPSRPGRLASNEERPMSLPRHRQSDDNVCQLVGTVYRAVSSVIEASAHAIALTCLLRVSGSSGVVVALSYMAVLSSTFLLSVTTELRQAPYQYCQWFHLLKRGRHAEKRP
jgi:hypothetical protein